MLLNDFIKISSHTPAKKYYLNLGYQEIEGSFLINVNDLPRHSGIIETRKCDLCLKNFSRKHESHVTTNIRFGMDICGECTKTEEIEKLIKEKRKQTNLIKYGATSPAKNPQVKEKTKNFFKEKYGCHPMKIKEIKEKFLKTVNEKYGGNSPLCDKKVLEKAKNTLYEENLIPVSSQQKKVYEILKELYPNDLVELNFKFSNIFFDIFLKIGNVSMDIEYDGKYWHTGKDREKYDRRRDEFVKSNGIKIMRIKGKHKIPKVEELIFGIEELKNSKRQYYSIYLSDWD